MIFYPSVGELVLQGHSAFSLRRVPIVAFEMGLYDERQVDDIKYDHKTAVVLLGGRS